MASRILAPQVFIAYAPRGEGLRCALGYFASGRDVYGWFTGPNGAASVASLYFVLEDFYSQNAPRYAAAQALELHAGWLLDEKRCHQLAELQEMFAAEWLFQRADAKAEREIEAYDRAQLALGEVNLRFERLNKLSKLQPTWSYYSPDFERGVLKALARRWPLEYGADEA